MIIFEMESETPGNNHNSQNNATNNTVPNKLKILMLGTSGHGKSSYVVRYVSGVWRQEYDPTIEDTYTKQTQVDGEHVLLEILDTAGEEEYSTLRDSYIKATQAIIIGYDITYRKSFEELPYLRKQILYFHKEIPIVVYGNKIDLEKNRQVTYEEGKKYCDSIGCPFFEISAKDSSMEALEAPWIALVRLYASSHQPYDHGGMHK